MKIFFLLLFTIVIYLNSVHSSNVPSSVNSRHFEEIKQEPSDTAEPSGNHRSSLQESSIMPSKVNRRHFRGVAQDLNSVPCPSTVNSPRFWSLAQDSSNVQSTINSTHFREITQEPIHTAEPSGNHRSLLQEPSHTAEPSGNHRRLLQESRIVPSTVNSRRVKGLSQDSSNVPSTRKSRHIKEIKQELDSIPCPSTVNSPRFWNLAQESNNGPSLEESGHFPQIKQEPSDTADPYWQHRSFIQVHTPNQPAESGAPVRSVEVTTQFFAGDRIERGKIYVGTYDGVAHTFHVIDAQEKLGENFVAVYVSPIRARPLSFWPEDKLIRNGVRHSKWVQHVGFVRLPPHERTLVLH